MLENKHKLSNHKLFEIIEQDANLSELRFFEIPFWPALRLKFFSKFINTNVSSKGKVGYSSKLTFIFYGCFELFKIYIFPLAIKKVRILFITKSTYRAKLNDYWFERFVDSLISLTNLNHKDYKVIEGTVDLKYRKPFFTQGKVEKLQGLFWLVGVYASVFVKSKKFENEHLLFSLIDKLNSNGIKIDNDSIHLFRTTASRIYMLSKVFERYLRITLPEKIFAVCYYEEYSMALLIAAKKLKIPYYDLQHGIQGSEHFAYSNFKNIPSNGYATLPDYFLCWDEDSANNINKWGGENHKAIVVGNPWLMYYNKFVSQASTKKADAILFTAQPYQDPLPSVVLSFLKLVSKTHKIIVRLHPRMVEDAKELEELILENEIPVDMDLVEASHCPLPQLLSRSVMHATISSSVVLEAADYGIGSFVFDEIGYKRFEHIKNVKVKLYTKEENIEEVVNEIISIKQESLRLNENERIQILKNVVGCE
ncbi:MAG: hypothetical protein ACK5QK_08195 [Chryseotalea sp.]